MNTNDKDFLVQKIRTQYTEKEITALDKLKVLDKKGIVIGIIGMVLLALAYPVYNYITKKERERIAPEILRLSEELLK